MKYLRKFLFPIGFLYGLVVLIRNLSYKSGFRKVHKLSVPVISVGNISVGGTGKTPMAEFLLKKLAMMGFHPAYLSRGYGRNSKGFLWVDPGASNGRNFGDEAFQVAVKFPEFPVAVCENRVKGVRQMLQERPEAFDVVVLDDAFQHLRIHRDLNLVMVDTNRLPWRDLMLPAGNLREPRLGLRRTDFFIFTKFKDPKEGLRLAQKYSGHTPYGLFQLQPSDPVPFFQTQNSEEGEEKSSNSLQNPPTKPSRILAFAGLGNNKFFFEQLEDRYGVEVETFAFPDHYVYQPEDLRKIVDRLQGHPKNSTNFGGALILTTEKDFFRLQGQAWLEAFSKFPIYYLPAQMVPLEGEKALEAQMNQMINEKSINGEND